MSFFEDDLLPMLGWGVVVIALIGLWAVLMALPTMLLWNWLMPELFHFKKIGFWQALGLNLLAGILFRSRSSSSKK